jgi:hypothetical protein
MFIQHYKFTLILGFIVFISQSAFSAEHYITKEIKYKTEDGWTISGTLRLPPGTNKNNEYPAMLLLHEKEHDRNEFVGIAVKDNTTEEIQTPDTSESNWWQFWKN